MQIKALLFAGDLANGDYCPGRHLLRPLLSSKTLLAMKLTFLLTIAFMNLGAAGLTQTVSFSGKEVSLKKIFNVVKNQTGYVFFYDATALRDATPVTISARNVYLEDFLRQALRNQPLSFSIEDKTIVIIRKKTTNPAVDDIAVAPPQTVSGALRDDTGNPVEGASVKLLPGNRGTTTNARGEFTLLNVPEGRYTLEISFIGFETISRAIVVSGDSPLSLGNLTLTREEALIADEVVVIGYGSQRKLEVTSAAASVKAKDFVQGSVKDVGQLLQGKVAGLAVNNVSGDPTAPSQILLRGVATLLSSTQPLVLIDGIPGDLATVPPNDIESIDVLKDGSAAAIYGTRGTNGVIIINTRKAKGSVTPVIGYDGYISTQEFIRLPKMLTASEYRQKISEGVGFQDMGGSTDWVKEISRQMPISHNHNLSVSGGSSKTNYFGSVNYRNLQGVVLQSDFQTINARLGLNHNMFNDRLKINVGVLVNEDNTGVDFGQTGNVGVGDSPPAGLFNQALTRNPTAPIKNEDGSWNENMNLLAYINPLGLIYESFGGSKAVSTRVSGSVSWEPVDNLNLKALGFRGLSDNQSGLGHTKQHISNTRDNKNGFARKSFGKNTSNLLELTADYTKSFDAHKITALVGYSYQDNLTESTTLQNWDFPAGNFSYLDNIGLGQESVNGQAGMMSSYKYESNLIGFFGRINYNYKDKYLLMASLRHEASSKLVGTKDPWGTFPSISAGWRISEEEFMSGSGFNELKLRAGYGVTGTAPSPYFLGMALLGYQSAAAHQNGVFYDGQWLQALSPTRNANPYLRWEEKKETNIGLDFGILNGRLSGSIDYYRRITDGLLYDYSVPAPPNAYGITTANVGVMKNSGLEILLSGTPVQSKNFTWNSSVTFSTNSNKLASISNDLYQATQEWFNTGGQPGSLNRETYTHRVEVGKAIGNFYGHKVLDITEDGKWIFEDAEGKPTEERLETNKKILGNGLPKYFASWNNTLRYGNLDLFINMRGAFGAKVLNYQRMATENPNVRLGFNQMRSAYDKIFGKAVLNSGTSPEYNSYYLESGDFVKIDNISIGYSIKKLKHVSASRVYVSVLNGIIITKYKGMDPEVPLLGLSPGNDSGNKYPSTRVYSIGWNITFN
ncbi:MAG TPA: SusC/RagA family TonB-linked outer membrane protein [Flavitalea sp.]|nr:SusC/RagA family TonB-linked outer membrane protein [Flavitalea sp.]